MFPLPSFSIHLLDTQIHTPKKKKMKNEKNHNYNNRRVVYKCIFHNFHFPPTAGLRWGETFDGSCEGPPGSGEDTSRLPVVPLLLLITKGTTGPFSNGSLATAWHGEKNIIITRSHFIACFLVSFVHSRWWMEVLGFSRSRIHIRIRIRIHIRIRIRIHYVWICHSK